MTETELRELPLHRRIAYMVDTYATAPKQENFAKLVGTTRHRVNAWVKGRSAPGADYAEQIAALGGYPAELFAPQSTLDWIARELADIRKRVTTQEEIGTRVAQQLLDQDRLLLSLAEIAVELRQAAADIRAATEALRSGQRPA